MGQQNQFLLVAGHLFGWSTSHRNFPLHLRVDVQAVLHSFILLEILTEIVVLHTFDEKLFLYLKIGQKSLEALH